MIVVKTEGEYEQGESYFNRVPADFKEICLGQTRGDGTARGDRWGDQSQRGDVKYEKMGYQKRHPHVEQHRGGQRHGEDVGRHGCTRHAEQNAEPRHQKNEQYLISSRHIDDCEGKLLREAALNQYGHNDADAGEHDRDRRRAFGAFSKTLQHFFSKRRRGSTFLEPTTGTTAKQSTSPGRTGS